MSVENETDSRSGGFDAAVSRREDDKLNRWAFATEIFGIATTGPQEWPVRIGIYGEWGTGKTSVLNLVETIAKSHGHIVVRFNPWEFCDKKSLWHAFVQAVVQKLPAESLKKKQNLTQWVKRKALPASDWFSKHSGDINAASDNNKARYALLGLDLLKGFLFSKGADLKNILQRHKEGRLIILIDDLDRTNGEIVPEMLFAIKELMNFGGLVFVCAFDPVIVGQILAEQHTGIDDGLKFLDKIIDYPRWLPAVSKADLLRMAEADVSLHCPYVPINALASVMPHLPQNARAVRQFIRLLALMKVQVDRHRPDEVHWPIILAANVIKVRFPRLATGLLEEDNFWHEVRLTSFVHDEKDRVSKMIKTHVQKTEKDLGSNLKEKERDHVESILRILAEQIDTWVGIREEQLMYQMRLAEAPAAVTLKEYDGFFSSLGEKANAQVFDSWISVHADNVGRTCQEVYSALFEITIHARKDFLGRAADSINKEGMLQALAQAATLLRVLEVLTFDLRKIVERDYQLNAGDFKLVLSCFEEYVHFTNNQEDKDARLKESDFLRCFVQNWKGSVLPLVEIIEPFSARRHNLEGKEKEALYKMLSEIVITPFAAEILERLCEQGFVSYVRKTFPVQVVVLDEDGPLWRGSREEVLKILRTAASDMSVYQNAYEILSWFDYVLRKEPEAGSDAQRVIKILTDPEIAQAVWDAGTIRPLNPRAIGSIKSFPDNCKKFCKIDLELPHWWTRILENDELKKKSEVGGAGQPGS